MTASGCAYKILVGMPIVCGVAGFKAEVGETVAVADEGAESWYLDIFSVDGSVVCTASRAESYSLNAKCLAADDAQSCLGGLRFAAFNLALVSDVHSLHNDGSYARAAGERVRLSAQRDEIDMRQSNGERS